MSSNGDANTSKAAPTFWKSSGLGAAISAVYVLGLVQVLVWACREAFDIRMYAIQEFGPVIHEFDPYFNYRAAEYLWQHGWRKFFTWFDYQSWYPLGRPVGTTIYPGMQFTAVWIKQFILPNWSINDICCYIPAWFGTLATLATAALAYICVASVSSSRTPSFVQSIPILDWITSRMLVPFFDFFLGVLQSLSGSKWGLDLRYYQKHPPALEAAVATACFMSVVPAHLMRSIGGGYDNESVATTAMQVTFSAWCFTLWVPEKRADSWPWRTTVSALVAAFAYFYMVAAWGGYIFVLNLIGVHAAYLTIVPKMVEWNKLYVSYSVFYVVGTLLAMQLPVVNTQPLKSLEQLGPMAVFWGLQALQLMFFLDKKMKATTWKEKLKIRLGVIAVGAAVGGAVCGYLWSKGFFGPLSARVRGLFVKHTKTGNPLVDSVAEHQAAKPEAYRQYLDIVADPVLAPFGFGLLVVTACSPSASFLLWYGACAAFFSHRMVRLILLTAPIASICAGVAVAYIMAWTGQALFGGDDRPGLDLLLWSPDGTDEEDEGITPVQEEEPTPTPKKKSKKEFKNGSVAAEKKSDKESDAKSTQGDALWTRGVRVAVVYYLVQQARGPAKTFYERSHEMAKAMSHPTIVTKGRNRNTGEEVLVDDYRQAYWWLRDNTPEDARIMAWWDYGYQITGISNRTTIADGNTWNHEHIALLGRTLTAPEKEAHRIARHLADYVLIWAGGGGDDLAKSPHLRRIANSVYPGLCVVPTCPQYGLTQQGPTPMMAESLLYKLHSNGIRPGVQVDTNRFREVFSTKYGKVRIYKIQSVSKESKKWVEENRVCDAPGSWYCPGQYPPALKKILKEKRDFAQLEDFNKGGSNEEYTRQYFEHLHGGVKHGGGPGDAASQQQQAPRQLSSQELDTKTVQIDKLSPDRIDMINEDWENTAETSMMFEFISKGMLAEMVMVLTERPQLAHIRSEDGRGPMWWAHEFGQQRIIEILKNLRVSEDRTDSQGRTPLDR